MAALAFSGAARQLAGRDTWIGWAEQARRNPRKSPRCARPPAWWPAAADSWAARARANPEPKRAGWTANAWTTSPRGSACSAPRRPARSRCPATMTMGKEQLRGRGRGARTRWENLDALLTHAARRVFGEGDPKSGSWTHAKNAKDAKPKGENEGNRFIRRLREFQGLRRDQSPIPWRPWRPWREAQLLFLG